MTKTCGGDSSSLAIPLGLSPFYLLYRKNTLFSPLLSPITCSPRYLFCLCLLTRGVDTAMNPYIMLLLGKISPSAFFFCFHSLSVEAFEQISYLVPNRSAPEQFTKLFFPFTKITYIPFPALVPLALWFCFLECMLFFLKLFYWYLHV